MRWTGVRGASAALAALWVLSAPTAAGAPRMPDFLHEKQPRARIVLLGTFHFQDAGLDDHKPEHGFDALSERRQKEIAQVLDRLAAWGPTAIAVEVRSERQAALDESYGKFLAGEKQLGANETHQIGFRLGKRLGHAKLHAVDAGGRSYFSGMTDEQYEARVASLLEGVDPARIEAEVAWDARFEEMYDWEDQLVDRQTLREHLIFRSKEETLQRHHGHYLIGHFKLGRDDDYFGADLKTRWYNRNLRILQNITRITRGPGERILVVIGSGHVPILRHALVSSPEYKLVEVRRVLGGR